MDSTKRVFITGASGFIGTALVTALVRAGYVVTNFDVVPPHERAHLPLWIRGSILDTADLRAAVRQSQAGILIHLAARTDSSSTKIDDYDVNTSGSANVVAVCAAQPTIQRLVFTSSQFVYGPFGLPEHDEDFRPHTAYGESKASSERHLRSSNLDICWTIVRPTNIWGPWHPRYPQEFWRVLRRGLYVHPRGPEVVRCYGYVGTVVDQIAGIIASSHRSVEKQVFYLGDPPVRLIDWVNGFVLQ